ncbi:hypothetical protein [Thiohalocapsa sp. ML1]|uniref:hypothetical protein n=1 Tax=Thiohalocapsa sp. ML1 TaxID=1431688 RepID=UPI001C1FC9B5|nr:hypothetical protein [Thiohalocapsa sp. ML1]
MSLFPLFPTDPFSRPFSPSGDLGEALEVLVGDAAKGLSPAALGRLKAQWSEISVSLHATGATPAPAVRAHRRG